MEGCVEVISREIVKPSSQLHNHHLKKLKLSYLDQLMLPMYVPIIFFYEANESSNHDQISQNLKHSLSQTLTSFYPLAGRLESDDNTVVACNDFGIEFVVARVHGHDLIHAIENPNTEALKKYLPIDPTSAVSNSEKPLLLVQTTLFDCGGIALCVCFSHLVADCKSISEFVNAWAGTCRDHEDSQISELVTFNLAEYFPPKEMDAPDCVWDFARSDEKFTTKRFVFTKEIMAHLKEDAMISSSRVKDPSRVELISAFICRQVAKSKDPKTAKAFAAMHAVNLRGKKLPTHLLENVFGNCFMHSVARFEEIEDIVGIVRSRIRKIDDEYITEAQSGDNYLIDLYEMYSELVNGEILECCVFSSWSRFPLYEVDFGFGKPFWLCTAALPLKNFVVFVDTKCGDNIEAWVNMEQHHLQMLQSQIDLILHSSTH